MNTTFSIIIPLYNKGKYIGRAICSVFNQTYQNFEIIVVDGESEDEGPEIVKFFNDPRIHYIVQSGKGVSNARNEGVHFANNEYIAFLDADDEWLPTHLETILRLIQKYRTAGMYSTSYLIQAHDGEIRMVNYQNIPDSPWEGLLPDYFKSGALGDYPVYTSVSVIPRKVFDELGGFPEGYWWAEDADLFGKIALKYPIAFSWELGAIYHWDAENRACDKFNRIDTLDFEDEPFFHTACAALQRKEVPCELVESVREYIARRQIDWACRYKNAGKFDKARILINQCKTQWFLKEKKAISFELLPCYSPSRLSKILLMKLHNNFLRLCVLNKKIIKLCKTKLVE